MVVDGGERYGFDFGIESYGKRESKVEKFLIVLWVNVA